MFGALRGRHRGLGFDYEQLYFGAISTAGLTRPYTPTRPSTARAGRGRSVAPSRTGAFGENLTTEGLLEDAVYVGDEFRVGT